MTGKLNRKERDKDTPDIAKFPCERCSKKQAI